VTGPLSVFEMLGLAIVIFGTGMAVAVTLILACFGAAVLYKFCIRGAEVYERDMKAGADLMREIATK